MASALTAVMAVAIVALRLMRRRQTRREQAFVERWRPVLKRVMVGDADVTLPALPARDCWLFLRLWNQFQDSVRGEATLRLSGLAYRLDCHHTARRLLRWGSRAEKLLAILTLGHLRDRAAWDLLHLQLTHGGRSTALYAARALLQIAPEDAVVTVAPLLLQREDWEISQVAGLLRDFRDVLGKELCRNLPALPPVRLPRAMRLAEALQLKVDPTLLLPWLQPDQHPDILVAGLRLASDATVLPAVRALADHADWRVRVQAVRALGRLGQANDVALLTRRLADPQWWVRYRAARALAHLPFLPHADLRILLESLPDRYAREIAIQVLAESERRA